MTQPPGWKVSSCPAVNSCPGQSRDRGQRLQTEWSITAENNTAKAFNPRALEPAADPPRHQRGCSPSPNSLVCVLAAVFKHGPVSSFQDSDTRPLSRGRLFVPAAGTARGRAEPSLRDGRGQSCPRTQQKPPQRRAGASRVSPHTQVPAPPHLPDGQRVSEAAGPEPAAPPSTAIARATHPLRLLPDLVQPHHAELSGLPPLVAGGRQPLVGLPRVLAGLAGGSQEQNGGEGRQRPHSRHVAPLGELQLPRCRARREGRSALGEEGRGRPGSEVQGLLWGLGSVQRVMFELFLFVPFSSVLASQNMLNLPRSMRSFPPNTRR